MKKLALLLLVVSVNSFSKTEEMKLCKKVVSKELSVKTDVKACVEFLKSIKGGIVCKQCPRETINCLPRPDCQLDLYE